MSLGILLGGGMLLIVLSADYFTNAVEWQGRLLRLGENAVGSLLAALGTALPETLVPVMALVFGGKSGEEAGIGVGAIIGAPFMLATLAFAILGLGLLLSRGRGAEIRQGMGALSDDLIFFLFAFGLVIAAGLLPEAWRWGFLAINVAAYAWHVSRILRNSRGPEVETSVPPLRLWAGTPPPRILVTVQLVMALVGLVLGAHFFVTALDALAHGAHLSGFLLSVIITPVATELPEVLNSVIWIRRGRDRLALGNVSGALAFQATVGPALGMALTPWRMSLWEGITAGLAWMAAFWIWRLSRQGSLRAQPLMGSGAFYLIFMLLAAASLH